MKWNSFAESFTLRSLSLMLSLLWMFPSSGGTAFAQALAHQAWSTEEGLPAAGVSQILQTRDGYLWLATEAGAVRFDGSSFKVLRHATQPAFTSDDVSALAEDASGALWIGTADGLIRIRGESVERFAEQDGLPASTILALAPAGENKIAALTSAGPVLFDGAKFRPFPGVPSPVYALASAAGGTVLLLTQAGVFQYTQGRLSPLPLPLDGEPPLGLEAYPDGSIWAWSAHSLVYSAGTVRHVWRSGRDFPESRITALSLDRNGADRNGTDGNGTAWIGTSRGLFSVDGPQGTLHPAEQLRNEPVLSLTRDREGNLWIGTQSSGLHALRRRKFRTEPSAAGEAVTAIAAAADGIAWFGTRWEGIRQVRNGAATSPVESSALTSPIVLSLATGDPGEVWVGTPDGLNRVRGKAVQQFTSANGLPDDFIRSLLVDPRGTVWAGTRRGLARLQHGEMTTFTRADGLRADSIGPLLAPRVRGSAASTPDLWIGTAAGLSRITAGHIESFSPGNDGERNIVTSLAEDASGHIWAGFHNDGLSRFEDGQFRKFTSSSLPSEIKALNFDHDGNLWLRGVDAVYRFAAAALEDCVAHAERCEFTPGIYSTLDGLPSNALTAEGFPLVAQMPSGELWFATRKGIAVTDPRSLPVNAIPPPVVIQRFTVDDAEEPIGTDELRIAPGSSRYTFEFDALSYTLPAKNRYRYMLEGFDRSWVDAENLHIASYTSLPPRHYRFRVQASNNDGLWNETGAGLRFRILPPVYRRWWFFLLTLLLAGALAAGIYLLRVHAVERRFALVLNERSRMAREVHDTIAQDLVSVSLQLDIATGLLKRGNAEGAAVQVLAARTLVKDGLDAARQSIWNLRAAAGEDSLPVRLTNLVRSGDRTPVPALHMGGAFRKLPHALEDEVFRIVQESLSNAQRHAAASEVRVELQYERDKLLLTVRDNGRGFSQGDAARLQGHYGLRGMAERAAALRADFTIISAPGEGTTVTLQVPLRIAEKTTGVEKMSSTERTNP